MQLTLLSQYGACSGLDLPFMASKTQPARETVTSTFFNVISDTLYSIAADAKEKTSVTNLFVYM